MSQVNQKVCRICGQDVSGKKRTKDAAGHYYCQPCYDAATTQRHAETPASPSKPPANSYACGTCGCSFTAEEVFDNNGAIICKGCWNSGTADHSDAVAASAGNVAQAQELFDCPDCGGKFTIANMDASGVCAECAAEGKPPVSSDTAAPAKATDAASAGPSARKHRWWRRTANTSAA